MEAQAHPSDRRGSEREAIDPAIWCIQSFSQRVEFGALLGQEYIGGFLSCSCCVSEENLGERQQVDLFIVDFEKTDQLDGIIIMPRVKGNFNQIVPYKP